MNKIQGFAGVSMFSIHAFNAIKPGHLLLLKQTVVVTGLVVVYALLVAVTVWSWRGKTRMARWWVQNSYWNRGSFGFLIVLCGFGPMGVCELIAHLVSPQWAGRFEMLGIVLLALFAIYGAYEIFIGSFPRIPVLGNLTGPKWIHGKNQLLIDCLPHPDYLNKHYRPVWASNRIEAYPFELPGSAERIPVQKNPEKRDLQGYLLLCNEGLWARVFGFGSYGLSFDCPEFDFDLKWAQIKNVVKDDSDSAATNLVLNAVDGQSFRMLLTDDCRSDFMELLRKTCPECVDY